MLRREGNVKGGFNLKPRQEPMEMQLNTADINRQWGVKKGAPRHPESNGIIGKNHD